MSFSPNINDYHPYLMLGGICPSHFSFNTTKEIRFYASLQSFIKIQTW